jgi:hypothetical protein
MRRLASLESTLNRLGPYYFLTRLGAEGAMHRSLLRSDLTTPEWDPNEDELEKQTLRELGGDDMGAHMKNSIYGWTPWFYIFFTLWRIERLLADSRAGNDAQVNSLPLSTRARLREQQDPLTS